MPQLPALNTNEITAAWLQRARLVFPQAHSDLPAVLRGVVDAVWDAGSDDAEFEGEAWEDARYLIQDVARDWGRKGASRQQIARVLRGLGYVLAEAQPDLDAIEVVNQQELIDQLILWSLEARIKRLNEIVEQQREEMEEISTPFIEIYKGIAVLPLVGTLDSQRAERVMETLLQGIAKHGSRVVVLDITGVPTVDTFVAQRMVKTVAAAKMMGTHCMLSGLGPEIALTMVRLGVDINVIESTARLSDALERGFKRLGLKVVSATS